MTDRARRATSLSFAWREDWLALQTETALDPERPIVDAHHHLWERDGLQRYMVEELHEDTGGGHNVEATVFVECRSSYRTADHPEHLRPVGETEFVASLVESSVVPRPLIAGIVAFADMTLGDSIDAVLDAHCAAGRGLVRGIRHATASVDDPAISPPRTRRPPGLMAESAFRAGVRRLARYGLSFDAWLYHPQLPELTALARSVPDVQFVLDHLGGPLGVGQFEGRRDQVLAGWRRDISELATCPNVVIKLGGIGMETFGLGFEERQLPPSSDDLVDAWRDPILYAIEQFGPRRCMFESNFPVDKASCSYVNLWNAFKRIADGFSEEEKSQLFHDSASRIYRLG